MVEGGGGGNEELMSMLGGGGGGGVRGFESGKSMSGQGAVNVNAASVWP